MGKYESIGNFFITCIIRVIESTKMRWVRHVENFLRNRGRILVGKLTPYLEVDVSIILGREGMH
jgi:hypothetical protein